MPAGASPSGNASGSSVTISWTAAVFADGTPVSPRNGADPLNPPPEIGIEVELCWRIRPVERVFFHSELVTTETRRLA